MATDPTASRTPEGRSDPRLIRTSTDEQCEELMREFPEFMIWVDFRPIDNGELHWHARQADWNVQDILNARDAQNMRDELIIWHREHPSGE